MLQSLAKKAGLFTLRALVALGKLRVPEKSASKKKIAPLSSPIFPQVGGITLDDLRRNVEPAGSAR
jgi:hypothetical protein